VDVARKTEAEVLSYLRLEHPESLDLAIAVRAAVLAADPDLVERVYRGWQGVGFRHPEAGYVCAVFPRGDRVDLLFEHGVGLPDPDSALTGSGTQTRSLPLTAVGPRERELISAFVQQAVAQRLLDR
jgi:hypothetical protein